VLNRIELAGRCGRYHKISYSAEAIDGLLFDLYMEWHLTALGNMVHDLDATDIPALRPSAERFFHG